MVLVVGSISNEAAAELQLYQPFADHLAESLAGEGITSCQVRVAGSISEMADLLRAGEVDVYIDSPYPMLQIGSQANTTLICRRWKEGVSGYNSVVFARRDSDLDGIDGLRGSVIGFEEAFSTSAYYLPKSSLQDAGYSFKEAASANSMVSADEIGYVFTDDDLNTMMWVLRGKVQAGAMSETAFESLAGVKRAELVVLHSTASVPRQLVCVRDGLAPDLVLALSGILNGMTDSEAGRAVLLGFQRTRRFDAIPEQQRIDLMAMQASLVKDSESRRPVTAQAGD